jgi:hypothetical protein
MAMTQRSERQMPPQHVQAYKDAVDNLIFLKRQQWQITNYSVIAQAALFILSKQVSPNPKAFLEWLTIPTMIVSIVVLWFMHGSMRKFRNRLATLYDSYFTQEERTSLHLMATHDAFFQGSFTTWILSLVCLAAGIVTLVII